MSHCPEYESLESAFIALRASHRLEAFSVWEQKKPEAERKALIERQTREELRSLRAVLDHAAEHGCQRSSPR
jgi:hypothetical protein